MILNPMILNPVLHSTFHRFHSLSTFETRLDDGISGIDTIAECKHDSASLENHVVSEESWGDG
jgi:hypothetical protein